MTGYAGSRDYVYGTCSLREKPHTDPHHPLKKTIPTLSWQTPTLSLRVLCGCSVHGTRNESVGVCHDRVGIIFFQWGMGSSVGFFTETTGSLYVIPGSGVVRHILLMWII